MAKTKGSLFSLGAHGSVGKAITFKKTFAGTVVRKAYFKKDKATEKQNLQRFKHSLHRVLWSQMRPEIKALWKDVKSPRGFNNMQAYLYQKARDLREMRQFTFPPGRQPETPWGYAPTTLWPWTDYLTIISGNVQQDDGPFIIGPQNGLAGFLNSIPLFLPLRIRTNWQPWLGYRYFFRVRSLEGNFMLDLIHQDPNEWIAEILNEQTVSETFYTDHDSHNYTFTFYEDHALIDWGDGNVINYVFQNGKLQNPVGIFNAMVGNALWINKLLLF